MAHVKHVLRAPVIAAAAFLAAGLASAHDKHSGDVVGVVGLDVYAARTGDVVDAILAVQPKGVPPPPVELRHTRSRDGGATWSSPVAILPGVAKVFSPRRGAEPQIAASGDRVVAIWTEPGTSPWGSGALASAVSTDGGKSWKKGPNPADDGTTKEHGFVDVAAFGPDSFLAVWLDGRDGGQGLRSAASKDGGASWGKNVDIEKRTCECCANRLLVRDGAVDVIYRGRDPRDMFVARTTNGGAVWQKLGSVAGFGWQFDGCPEVAGALTSVGPKGSERIYAMSWTGKESDAGVWISASNDLGHHWTKPVRMGTAGAKQLDIASSGGCVTAVWDEYREDAKRRAIFTSSACGNAWARPAVLSSPDVDASYPVAVGTARGVLVAWTERAGSGEVGWKTQLLAKSQKPVPAPR